MASADLKVIISGDAKGLSNAYRDAEGSTKRFGSTVGKVGLLAGGAAAAGIVGLAAGLKSSVSAAMEAEKVQASLAAQLKASGISFDQNRARIDAAIGSLSNLSGLDDEQLTSGFTRLVRSTGNVKDAMAQMTLVADIARARNMDVSKAADVVGKVLDGNTGILKRYGVEIEKGATVTQALGAAQSKFAGQAEAYGKTSAGAQDRLRVAFENVQETIGAKLLPAFNKVLVWGSEQMPKVSAFFEKHSGTIQAVMDSVSGFVRDQVIPRFNQFREIASLVITGVRKVFDQNGPEIKRILGAIGTVVKDVGTVMLWLTQNVVIPVLKPMLTTVLPAAIGIAIKALDGIIRVIGGIKDGFMWIASHGAAAFDGFKRAIGPIASQITSTLQPVFAVLNSIRSAMSWIMENVGRVLSAAGKLGGVAGLVGKLPGMATGGPVSAGQAYIVGEKGPELFVPGSSGTIIPNGVAPSSGSLASQPSGTTIIQISFPNYLGQRDDVVRDIRDGLIELGRRNAGGVLGGLA